jgi:hypothetical protein
MYLSKTKKFHVRQTRSLIRQDAPDDDSSITLANKDLVMGATDALGQFLSNSFPWKKP